MWNVNAFLATLPMMLKGMGGIFITIVVIYLLVMLLRRVFPTGESEG